MVNTCMYVRMRTSAGDGGAWVLQNPRLGVGGGLGYQHPQRLCEFVNGGDDDIFGLVGWLTGRAFSTGMAVLLHLDSNDRFSFRARDCFACVGCG